MKIVGLTGGIGSGKTTIANFFSELGIPVYTADTEAKKIMNTDVNLMEEIKNLLGSEAYIDGQLNRKWIADKVFHNQKLLTSLNALVHPAVANDFESWLSLQTAPYVIKEAAILFENDSYQKCDYIILVKAPQAIRIERVTKRDKVSQEKVLARMNVQWSDIRKEALADATIENVNLDLARKSVGRVHVHLLKRMKSGW